jgi:hypothetical protein
VLAVGLESFGRGVRPSSLTAASEAKHHSCRLHFVAGVGFWMGDVMGEAAQGRPEDGQAGGCGLRRTGRDITLTGGPAPTRA